MSSALLLTVLAVGCTPEQQRGNGEVAPELTFENLSFRAYRGPVLTAVGTAQRASLRRDTGDLRASTIVVRFSAQGGHPPSTVTAANGAGNLKDRTFTAGGGIRAEQAGQVAVTERASSSKVDGLVRGDRPIVVRSDRFTVRGPAFTLDPHDEVLNIIDGASADAGGGGR